MAHKISFLLPSRERAEQCKSTIANIQQMTQNMQYEILMAIDYDDPQRADYEKLTGIDVLAVMDKRSTPGQCCNALIASASGNIIAPHSDDIIIQTPDYASVIREQIRKADDPYFVLQPYSGLDWRMTIMIFSSEFIREVGYLSAPRIQHWYADTWIGDIAIMADCVYRMPSVLFYHNHYMNHPEVMDKTYEYQRRDNDAIIKADKAVYEDIGSVLERTQIANKIARKKLLHYKQQLPEFNLYKY